MTPAQFGDVAASVLRQHGCDTVMWGDVRLLHAIADAADLPKTHPLKRTQSVLDRLERAPQFEKSLARVKMWCGSRDVRSFTVKVLSSPPTPETE